MKVNTLCSCHVLQGSQCHFCACWTTKLFSWKWGQISHSWINANAKFRSILGGGCRVAIKVRYSRTGVWFFFCIRTSCCCAFVFDCQIYFICKNEYQRSNILSFANNSESSKNQKPRIQYILLWNLEIFSTYSTKVPSNKSIFFSFQKIGEIDLHWDNCLLNL